MTTQSHHNGRLRVYGHVTAITGCLFSSPILSRLQGVEHGDGTFKFESSPYEDYPYQAKASILFDDWLSIVELGNSFEKWPDLLFTIVAVDQRGLSGTGLSIFEGEVTQEAYLEMGSENSDESAHERLLGALESQLDEMLDINHKPVPTSPVP